MPKISYFLGISVYMYYDDHNPPHFHAIYNEFVAVLNINTGKIIAGKLPPKVYELIKEWMDIHKKELLKDWELAKKFKKLKKIKPLI
jgi:hypothetical protein